MNIQNLRDLVAQINAAHPVENHDLPLLLEGKNGFLQITFMAGDIKMQLHHWWGIEEDWCAIAPFHELSDIAWNLGEVYRDFDLVTISLINGLLKVECKES